MHHGSDISWQALRRIVQDWLGTSAELAEVKSLHGGTINTTVSLLTKGGERAVLKVSPHRVDRSYIEEAHQLGLLKEAGLPVPEIYAVKLGALDDPFSYILLEHVDGVDLLEAKRQCPTVEGFDRLQCQLAELVAALHNRTGPTYARVASTGLIEHPNWPAFFREIYDTIWHETAKAKVLPVKTVKIIERIHQRLETLLAHDDKPRLLHWDLWSSNILARGDAHGQWQVAAILDPMCKFAHAEAEIAYLELFHTVTPAFIKTYQQTHKLSPDYGQRRKWIYQLYPLIDHVHAFGPEYVKPLLATVDKCAAFV